MLTKPPSTDYVNMLLAGINIYCSRNFVIALTACLAFVVPNSVHAQSDARVSTRDRAELIQGDEGETEDVEQRERDFYDQRKFPFGAIPAGARLTAIQHMEAMARERDKHGAAMMSTNKWESIGPSNGGGRIRAIAIRTDGQGLFIGAAAGGVWRTKDKGATWVTSFDKQASLAMGAIAIDPNDQNVIYAGTGENTANVDSYLGAGVFKSTDNGDTWLSIGLTSVGAISKLAVSKDDPKIIYAATTKGSGGFYRTTNGGAQWTRTYSQGCFDMSVCAKDNDFILISTDNNIARSEDGGITFTSAESGITLTNASRISVAIAPSTTDVAYCLVCRTGGTSGNIAEIYKTADRGTTWVLKKAYPTGSFFNSQGWYDNAIAVHPTNAGLVLIAGIDVYRSTDSATSFTNTTKSYSGGSTHPDQHMLLFDPVNPETVYLGNDGGVYSSSNSGTSWTKITTTLPVTQFYRFEIDQSRPFRAFGGSQDNGSWGALQSSGFSQQWTKILSGDGFYCAVDLTNPDILYAENYNGSPLYRVDANTRVNTRIDAAVAETGAWSSPIAMSPADKVTLYSGRRNLWRTSNRGTSWTKLTVGNTSNITAIGLSPFDTSMIAIGTGSAELYTSRGGGYAFSKVSGIPVRSITSIVYDPSNPARVYFTVSGFGSDHVYRSDDAGITFASCDGNLPNIPVNGIAVDSADNAHLFVATDIGVFMSVDAGDTWVPFSEGLPVSPVADVRVHNSTRMLLAATHGRSMFRVSIDGLPQSDVDPSIVHEGTQSDNAIESVSVNPIHDNVVVTYRLSHRQHVRLELFSQTGERAAVLRDETLDGGTYRSDLSVISLSSGVYYLRMTGDKSAPVTRSVVVVR